MTDPKGYYQVLDLAADADASQIKESYREHAKIWHPDHNQSPEAMEKFQRISVAYDILGDEKNRLMYDLLSQVYAPDKFPDMSALKVYKNQKDREDIGIRAIHLKQVIGKIIKAEVNDYKYICNYHEAQLKVLQNHFSNWLLGWWGIKAFKENLKAIKDNYRNIGTNLEDNLQLLVHNTFAYANEGKKDKAYATALQALQYADKDNQELINKYIYLLGLEGNPKLPRWNWLALRYIQLLIPAIVALFIALEGLSYYIKTSDFNKYWLDRSKINYYREVKVDGNDSSSPVVNDMVVSKIVNLPPDTNDTTLLYHTTGFVNVMYGPDENFDISTRLGRGHTVRLTGYSPDKVWARIMLDNGDSGFVKMDQLQSGIKDKIPPDSKIFTGYSEDNK